MRITTAFGRFLLSGGFNTLLTYAIYLMLLHFLSYRISFTITFIIGIVIAYVLSRYFVFAVPSKGRRVMMFPIIYIIQYIVSMLMVFLWVDWLQLHVVWAPLASIVITIPITFALNRWVFKPVRNNEVIQS